MTLLERHIVLMPVQERSELLQEYAAHFEFGRQNGKSEEEIAQELGHPVELAYEILGDRYVDPQLYTPKSQPQLIRTSSIGSKIGKGIGLFFLNVMLVIPLMAALYSLGVAVTGIMVSCLAAPLLVVVDFLIHGQFVMYKIFLALIMVGIGLFMIFGVKNMWKSILALTLRYIVWNKNVVMGRDGR
ncbi:HAAS signaling domain-containing protein [Paenibacillus guangzhouensis]|uniref:HAAS signaling domain-containing protein n=1 Tax=Paenibacillus guangzhouensis TaxID=1473112 RepID=UPI00187B3058|nr:DUF1700 domain-containing protein [Paenibacillus guangzhouensis]